MISVFHIGTDGIKSRKKLNQ